MFHCNGWGMPYAVTGMGGTHVVLRKVDGEEILSRIERHGVTLLLRRRPWWRRFSMRRVAGLYVPKRGPDRPWCRHGPYCGGRRSATIEGDRTDRDRARMGVHSDLRLDGDVAPPHHQSGPVRMGRCHRHRPLTAAEPGRRAGRRGTDRRRRRRGSTGPVQPRLLPTTGSNPPRPRPPSTEGGSTRVTVAIWTAAISSSPTARRTSSSPGARTCRPLRWRTASTNTRPWPKWR